MAPEIAKRRRGIITSFALMWAAVSLLLISAVDFSFAKPAHATENAVDVLLTIDPSVSDSTLLSVVQQSLARVNKASLDELSDQDDLTGLQKKYDALQSMAQTSQQGSSVFLLRSVSWPLVEAFRDGNLPQSALFSACAEVSAFAPEKSSADSFNPANIRMVQVRRSQVDAAGIVSALKSFETQYRKIDPTYRAFLSSDADQLTQIGEDQLRELVKKNLAGVSDAAQLELDQRLAANLPSLHGYKNGLLPDDLLCKIPWDHAGHQTLCPALDSLSRLNDAFKAKFGMDLPILDGYRPLASQQAVHVSDPTMTAVPGTSNHGWGLAVDFDWDMFANFDDPQVVWMIENGPKFGWRHPACLGKDTDRPEPWHYEFGTSYPDRPEFDGPAPAVDFRFTF